MWPVAAVAVVLLLLAVVLCVQRMVRTAEARRIAASTVAQSGRCAPATESLPPVGAVDLEELWMEVRFAMTLHRIGGDVTDGAPKEWVQ